MTFDELINELQIAKQGMENENIEALAWVKDNLMNDETN